jgi:NarL family two-component system response regulator LiaR
MFWRTAIISGLVLGTVPRTRRLRVLVAERDEATRRGIAAALERAGSRVVASCPDGTTAIAALGRHRIDVCLIGLDLPGGGVTTARAIAGRRNKPRIIILASTARERDIFAALRAGADSFVVKDVDAAALPQHVAAVAAGEAVLPEGMTVRLIDEFRSLARSGDRGQSRDTDPAGALAPSPPRKGGS